MDRKKRGQQIKAGKGRDCNDGGMKEKISRLGWKRNTGRREG